MKIGVLGTGVVGESIAGALVKKGHHVMMGSRTKNNEKAIAWKNKMNGVATNGDFSDACIHGDIIFNCMNGGYTMDVFKSIPKNILDDKIIVDVSNPLDFSKGIPPRILPEFENISLAESLQLCIPAAHVVKALNTINYKLMVDARIVNEGNHNLFICGNDKHSKYLVKHLLVENFYWKPDMVIDLGDISHARATEAIVPFWVLVWQSLSTPLFNFKVVQ